MNGCWYYVENDSSSELLTMRMGNEYSAEKCVFNFTLLKMEYLGVWLYMY